YGISSRTAKQVYNGGDPKYRFTVTFDDQQKADKTLYNNGHEAFVHVDNEKKALDQSFDDYKSGKNQSERYSPENILASTLTKVKDSPSEHKLMVDGKVTNLETFVKALDNLMKTTKFSDMLEKDKKFHKDNPQL